MKIDLSFYKNNKLIKKDLNIHALYDKTNARLQFNDEEATMEIVSNHHLKRVTNDYILFIDIVKKEATLELINYTVINIKILFLEYFYKSKEIILIYRLETEPDITNKIIIKLERDLI